MLFRLLLFAPDWTELSRFTLIIIWPSLPMISGFRLDHDWIIAPFCSLKFLKWNFADLFSSSFSRFQEAYAVKFYALPRLRLLWKGWDRENSSREKVICGSDKHRKLNVMNLSTKNIFTRLDFRLREFSHETTWVLIFRKENKPWTDKQETWQTHKQW